MGGKSKKKYAKRYDYWETKRTKTNKVRRLTRIVRDNPNDAQAKADLIRWSNA